MIQRTLPANLLGQTTFKTEHSRFPYWGYGGYLEESRERIGNGDPLMETMPATNRIPPLLAFFMGALCSALLLYGIANESLFRKVLSHDTFGDWDNQQALWMPAMEEGQPQQQQQQQLQREDNSLLFLEEQTGRNNKQKSRQQLQQQRQEGTGSSSLSSSPLKRFHQPWLEPKPAPPSTTLVVLVMSGRSHVERRAVIRQTWARNKTNVFFVLGEPCLVPPDQRTNDLECQRQGGTNEQLQQPGTVPEEQEEQATMEEEEEEQVPATSSSSSSTGVNETYLQLLREEDQLLLEEQELHRDLIVTPRPESYSGLPFKLKEAYDWAIRNHPSVEWLVKADDDMYVRVTKLQSYLHQQQQLQQLPSPRQPIVLGHIMIDAPVHRNGKWKEMRYQRLRYPPFALGSWGHVVSRPVADYVAQHKEQLVEYQGEDTSLGIWLNESPLATQFLTTDDIATNRGFCRPQFLIIGHNLPLMKLKRCYIKYESASLTPATATSTTSTTSVVGTTPQTPASSSSLGGAHPSEWMPPHITNATTVVIVMTARKHFPKRRAIRETWATGHDNVYFVVGPPCPYPIAQRQNDLTCEKRAVPLQRPPGREEAETERHNQETKQQEESLLEEQREHRDMLYTTKPESYRGLVHKLKEAYTWVVQNTAAEWVVKADDDTVVRVDSVHQLLQRYSPSNPTVVGRIIYNAPVHKTGKWADLEYNKQSRYPPWPQGSCGHAVSRPIAEFVAANKESLYEYQGEDTTLAIWLDESELKDTVVWEKSPAFVNEGDCHNPNFVVIGHEISPLKMKRCYHAADEVDVSKLDG